MLPVLVLAMSAAWQKQVGWNPIERDHRPDMIMMFVAGAAVVALFVIVRRLMRSRREGPANRKILE
jgi:hypothetical protein